MSWTDMKRRCLNPKNKQYEYYGGRGISIYKPWLIFDNFLKDMGPKPEGLTLERINNDLHYAPGNCRWATKADQNRNKRIGKIMNRNKTGLRGVAWDKSRNRWISYGHRNGITNYLYHGRDFFEACCARKSWEAEWKG